MAVAKVGRDGGNHNKKQYSYNGGLCRRSSTRAVSVLPRALFLFSLFIFRSRCRFAVLSCFQRGVCVCVCVFFPIVAAAAASSPSVVGSPVSLSACFCFGVSCPPQHPLFCHFVRMKILVLVVGLEERGRGEKNGWLPIIAKTDLRKRARERENMMGTTGPMLDQPRLGKRNYT